MSIFKKLAIQHGVAVVRETDTETGKMRVVSKVSLPEVERASAQQSVTSAEAVKKLTWRTALRKLTRNGEDLHQVLYNLAMGNPEQVRLPDGRVSEPIIPSPEVRRAAAADLLDRIHGKAVAQTEVVKAEMEAEDHAQYAAMSDEQLQELIAGTKWAIAAKKREALSAGTREGSDGD